MRNAAAVPVAAVGVALVVGFAYARRARFSARQLRLAVLNPRDGSTYNKNIMQMLEELFAAAGASGITLHEIDVRSRTPQKIEADAFDGYIVPGSLASAYDKDPWIDELAATLKALHAAHRPMLGICFGHQILASALGGKVELNAKGLQAAACTFEPTSLGRSVLRAEGSVSLLYHHNDIVSRLPSCASNLGASALNPAHCAALFASPTAARMADVRGSLSLDRPHGITFQAHPEFSTPTGKRVLASLLLERDAPKFGEEWAQQKLASVDDPATTVHALQQTAAAIRVLWPSAMSV